MLDALPQGYAVALVSDHGFERVESLSQIKALAAQKQVTGIEVVGSVVRADSPAATAFLRDLAKDSRYGVGREIPKAEVERFAPELARADSVFESAPGFLFGSGDKSSDVVVKSRSAGSHGHWPMRYRSVYAMWDKRTRPGRLPEMPMTEIAAKLAHVLGISFSATGVR
jgi:hypothetical protein